MIIITFKAALSLLSSGSILIPLLAGVHVWKTMSLQVRWFFYFILITFPFEVFFIVTSMLRINNLFFVNVFILVEYLCLALILLKWIYPCFRPLYSLLVATAIISFWTGNALIFGKDVISEYVLITKHALLLVLASAFLIHFLRTSAPAGLKDGCFWIALGVFIYFTSTIVLCVYPQYVFTHSSIGKYYIYFHSAVNIFCNIIYAKGLLCHTRKTSLSSTF
jgi:hypothetical protein